MIHFHGDSITAGYGVDETARLYYPWLTAEWLGEEISNHAVPGYTTADLWATIKTLSAGKHCILIGENNHMSHGDSAEQLASYRTQLDAMAHWLTHGKRTLQHADWTFTGTWLDTASVGKYAAGPATATVTFSGDEFRLGYVIADWYAAGFSVSIDGVDKGTFTCEAPTIGPIHWAPALLRIPGCGAGQHTATISTVGADATHYTFLDCVYDEPAGGDVFVLTLPRINQAIPPYSNYPAGHWDAVVANYNAQIASVVAQADGATLVDITPLLDPVTCTMWSGDHPNNRGHVAIAKALISAME